MIIATLINENILLGLAYSFRNLVHYHHGRKHGGMQADIMLETKLRVLYPDWQVIGKDTGPGLSI